MAFIFTKPRGTVARQWPDWRLDELCVGSAGVIAANPALFYYISFFNNDNSGRAAVIWNAMYSVDTFNFLNLFVFQNHRGTAVPGCSNVSPQRAPAFGQMFRDTPAAKYTDTPYIIGGTFIGQLFPPNTPALVVPAGWSVAFGSDIAGADTTMTIWYLPTGGI
jgi:hypothetical protein